MTTVPPSSPAVAGGSSAPTGGASICQHICNVLALPHTSKRCFRRIFICCRVCSWYRDVVYLRSCLLPCRLRLVISMMIHEFESWAFRRDDRMIDQRESRSIKGLILEDRKLCILVRRSSRHLGYCRPLHSKGWHQGQRRSSFYSSSFPYFGFLQIRMVARIYGKVGVEAFVTPSEVDHECGAEKSSNRDDVTCMRHE